MSTPSLIEHIREEGKFHGHIHAFDANSFDDLKRHYIVTHERIVGILSRGATALTEPYQREWRQGTRWPKVAIDCYNECIPALKKMARIFGRWGISLVMRLDRWSCRVFGSHAAIMFVVLKDRSVYTDKPTRDIMPDDILNVTVPYFYMKSR